MEPVDETGVKEAGYGTTTTFDKEATVSSMAKGLHNICRVETTGLPCWAVNDLARVFLRWLSLVDQNGCGCIVSEDLMTAGEPFVRINYDSRRVWSSDVANCKSRVVCGNGSGTHDDRVDECSESMQTFKVSRSGYIM